MNIFSIYHKQWLSTILLTVALNISVHVYSDQITLFLIRHGETDWNAESRCQGQTDRPLNAEGKKQALEVAMKLTQEHPDLAAIYSSDLSRAYHTGLETAKLLGLEVTQCPALREIDYGEAEGMNVSDRETKYQEIRKELRTRYPNKRDYWQHASVPKAETEAQVMERMKAQLTDIAQKHLNQKVAIFSHGRALKCFIADIRDREVDEIFLHNCAIVKAIYNTETASFEIEI